MRQRPVQREPASRERQGLGVPRWVCAPRSGKSMRAALLQCSRSKPSGSMPHMRQSPGGRLASSVAYSAKASAWSVFIWLTMSVSADVSSGASATLAMRSRRRKIDDPAEAADVVAAGDLERVHGKIGKVGVGPGRGMAREKPSFGRRARGRSRLSGQRETPAGHGIAQARRAVNQQACARIRAEILRVKSQARDQEEGRAIRLGGDQDERGVRMPARAVEGAERRLEGRAYQVARGRRRLWCAGRDRRSELSTDMRLSVDFATGRLFR